MPGKWVKLVLMSICAFTTVTSFPTLLNGGLGKAKNYRETAIYIRVHVEVPGVTPP